MFVLPCLSLALVNAHGLAVSHLMFATIAQSILLTLALSHLVVIPPPPPRPLPSCLLDFRLFPQKMKGLRMFNVKCVNKAHGPAQSAGI